MNLTKTNKGVSPVLAVFVVLVIISSGLVVAHLQSIGEREVSAIQLLTASDESEAALSSINSDLSLALEESIKTAMHDVGKAGGDKENGSIRK